ncbi:MAG: FecR domain-containing protein [Anaerolineales bacterium]|nr:FecR domain-containing protein [Anaerolineales bacterium]
MKMQVLPCLTVAVIILSACGSPTVVPAAEPMAAPTPTKKPQRVAEFSEIEADVQARQVDETSFSQANPGQQLTSGGQARTGDPGKTRLDILPEGTIVRLGPDTQFEMIEMNEDTQNPLSRLKLLAGQLWIILNGGELSVETELGTASVRGSYMGVRFDPRQETLLVTCLEGSCNLSSPAGSLELTDYQAAEVKGAGNAPMLIPELFLNDLLDWSWNNPEAEALVGTLSSFCQILKEDAGALDGRMYWNPTQTNWIVVLDPMLVDTQDAFREAGVVSWLLKKGGPLDKWESSLPEEVALNVATYNPTGHQPGVIPGLENGMDWQEDAASLPESIRSGCAGYLDAQMNVPTCHVYVGASTGADRAILSCAASPANCAGVISLSPGGYLGVSFATEYAQYQAAWEEYKAAGDFSGLCPGIDPEMGAKIYCVASAGDDHSSSTCNSVSGENYEAQIFSGSGHGMSYFWEAGSSSDFENYFRDILVDIYSARP